MTLVNTDTGEIAVMSEGDARELIDSLKTSVGIAERQIIRAWEGRAWLALGYESWDEMVAIEFKSHYLKITPDERRAKAIEMAKVGMSTRAVASALGVNHGTIVRDLNTGGASAPPDDNNETEEAETPPTPVVGLDGKTYPAKPKPPSVRRSPITDDIGRAANDLLKFSERITSIINDNRFDREKNELAAPLRNQLANAIEALQRLMAQLDTETETSNV